MGSLLLLNRLFAALVRSNPDRVFDSRHEDFSVSDLSGTRRFDDGINGGLNLRIRQYNLKFHLREKVHRILAAAINFSMPLLPAEASDFSDCHALDADVMEGLFDIVYFERLDDGFN